LTYSHFLYANYNNVNIHFLQLGIIAEKLGELTLPLMPFYDEKVFGNYISLSLSVSSF